MTCPECGVTVERPTEPGMVHGCWCSRVAWFYGDEEPQDADRLNREAAARASVVSAGGTDDR